jgi:hypothetical protein
LHYSHFEKEAVAFMGTLLGYQSLHLRADGSAAVRGNSIQSLLAPAPSSAFHASMGDYNREK